MAEIESSCWNAGRCGLESSAITATIYQDRLAGDVGGALGGEPDDDIGELLGGTHALDGGVGGPSGEDVGFGLARDFGTRSRELFEAVGSGEARANIVDEDAVFAELVREALDQSNDGGADGVGVDEIGNWLLHGNRGDGDEASPVGALHVGDYLPGEVNDAEEVGFEGPLPFVVGGGEKAFCRRAARVGNADVDALKALGSRGYKALDGGGIGDVDGLGEDIDMVLLAKLFSGGLDTFFVAGADGESSALGGEGRGTGESQSLTGSTDDGDAIFQSSVHDLVVPGTPVASMT